jgi:hypothetical protein
LTKPSKFSAVFQNRQEDEPVIPEREAEEIVVMPDAVAPHPTQSRPPEQDPSIAQNKNLDRVPDRSAETIETPIAKKMGRPTGKRSNPNFTQVTAYIHSQTYRDVKVALLLGEERQEFSELIEDLLGEWLNTQKSE